MLAKESTPKPISRDDITRTVSTAAENKALLDKDRHLGEENRKHQQHLVELLDEQTRQLRDSEGRLGLLFEKAPNAYYLNDLKGTFIDGNEAAEKLTGYSKEELIGKSFLKLKLLSPKQIAKASTLLARNALGKDTGPDEFILTRKDGKQVPVEIRTRPVKIQDKRMVLGLVRDITERKRTKEALRERVKELGCLYAISELVEKPDISLEEILQGAVDLIPTAWQYPEIACARIIVDGKQFETENFGETIWKQASDILLHGERIGTIEVCYLEERDERDEGPFLKEERSLLNTVAKRLGRITEHKKAEAKLQRLAQVLRGIRNVNQLIIREKDRDKLLKGACDNLVETRGYSSAWITLLDESGKPVKHAESGLGKDFLPMVKRLKRGQLLACMQRALKQSEPVVTEDPISACTDCPLSASYAGRSAAMVRLEYEGKVYGLLSVPLPRELATNVEELGLLHELATDIAFALHDIELEEQRKLMEEALRESEKKYRLLAENVSDVIFVQDMNFNMTYISPSVTRLSGYSVEEALNQQMKDFYAPDSFAKAMDSFQQAAALAKTNKDIEIPPMEYEYVRKDGSTFWGEVKVTFLHDSEGRAVGIQGVLRDTTERKRAEEEMRVKDNAIASSINGIAIADLEGNLTYANHSFLEMWGYHDEKDVVGRNAVEFWQAEEDAAEVMKVATQRGGWIGELLAKRKDGSAFDVHAATSVVRDPSARPVCRVASFVDITERKRAEEALRTTLNGTIQAIGQTTEMRDPYTAGHQRRVTQLACAIINEMGLPKEQAEGTRVAGLMHDIGKMSIPAEILAKPSKLSETEFDLIKAHSQAAYDILKSIDFPWPVADIILQHHERLNGSGYPKGIKDGHILLEARILGIADVVEALSSHRPYRPALGIDKALEEIEKNKGTLYDPEVVDACLRLFSEGRFEFDT